MPRVLLVGFDGLQTLDFTGPAEVFASANRFANGRYRIHFTSMSGGIVTTTSGAEINTRALSEYRARRDDTILVAGGPESALTSAVLDTNLVRWVAGASRSRRIGSVCTGAFVLARAGLLDGRRVATHWAACSRLARFRPQASVDANSIFVQDGNVWTSAGVTTGIDMALAMVSDDLGSAAADMVAARLVLYARRPGFQSQFSNTLVAQQTHSDPLGGLLVWARAHLPELTPERLARRAGQSTRTFHRRCTDLTGTTPAKLIEKLRVEQARTLLSTTSAAPKSVATDCGFGSVERMHRAFMRELGVAPRDYRLLFDGVGRKSEAPSAARAG